MQQQAVRYFIGLRVIISGKGIVTAMDWTIASAVLYERFYRSIRLQTRHQLIKTTTESSKLSSSHRSIPADVTQNLGCGISKALESLARDIRGIPDDAPRTLIGYDIDKILRSLRQVVEKLPTKFREECQTSMGKLPKHGYCLKKNISHMIQVFGEHPFRDSTFTAPCSSLPRPGSVSSSLPASPEKRVTSRRDTKASSSMEWEEEMAQWSKERRRKSASEDHTTDFDTMLKYVYRDVPQRQWPDLPKGSSALLIECFLQHLMNQKLPLHAVDAPSSPSSSSSSSPQKPGHQKSHHYSPPSSRKATSSSSTGQPSKKKKRNGEGSREQRNRRRSDESLNWRPTHNSINSSSSSETLQTPPSPSPSEREEEEEEKQKKEPCMPAEDLLTCWPSSRPFLPMIHHKPEEDPRTPPWMPDEHTGDPSDSFPSFFVPPFQNHHPPFDPAPFDPALHVLPFHPPSVHPYPREVMESCILCSAHRNAHQHFHHSVTSRLPTLEL